MVTEDMTTLNSIHKLHDLRKAEMKHKDLEPLAKLVDAKNWPKTMESIDEYLFGCLRVLKTLLSYIIRKDNMVKEVAKDPAMNYYHSG